MLRHKYRAKQTIRNGIKFQSTKEAKYYDDLLLRQKAGEVLFFLRQVPFDLPGGLKYRADYIEFWTNGTVKIIDVKGYKTKEFIRNKKMVEALYPIEIEIK